MLLANGSNDESPRRLALMRNAKNRPAALLRRQLSMVILTSRDATLCEDRPTTFRRLVPNGRRIDRFDGDQPSPASRFGAFLPPYEAGESVLGRDASGTPFAITVKCLGHVTRSRHKRLRERDHLDDSRDWPPR